MGASLGHWYIDPDLSKKIREDMLRHNDNDILAALRRVAQKQVEEAKAQEQELATRQKPKNTPPEQPKTETIELEPSFNLHYVKWNDAALKSGWMNLEEIKAELKHGLIPTETVGFLVFQNDQYVALAQSTSRQCIDCLMLIPKGVIVDMYRIKPPESEEEQEAKASKERQKRIFKVLKALREGGNATLDQLSKRTDLDSLALTEVLVALNNQGCIAYFVSTNCYGILAEGARVLHNHELEAKANR